MPNIIRQNFASYVDTRDNFDRFHNQVMNMPRDSFSVDELLKIKIVCGYIDLLSAEQLNAPKTYPQLVSAIKHELAQRRYPAKRDMDFENDYFSDTSRYNDPMRMLRHFWEMLVFFGIMQNSTDAPRSPKIVDKDRIREIVLSPDNILVDLFRNILLETNINNNSFFINKKSINVKNDADYKPAINILKYCKEINRPATFFEISVLLGRIDEVQTENEIFTRAMEVGRSLPANQDEQISHFFGNMGWKTDGTFFTYATSQEPYFKFYSLFLYLKTFGFVDINETNSTITNTVYSAELLQEAIPFELLDLENLLRKIDDDTAADSELSAIILRRRTAAINQAIQNDTLLVEKFNKRAIRKPIIKDGKRKRNQLIAEIAKIKANYCDELTRAYTFIGRSGNGYVEAHHLIEFSTENGPDITDNLVCFNPDNHSRIHRGSVSVAEDVYLSLRTQNVVTLDRFKKISNIYKCLTLEHIRVLHNKKLISLADKEELTLLVTRNGVDPQFLTSLQTAASE